jgi:hypothetical protein
MTSSGIAKPRRRHIYLTGLLIFSVSCVCTCAGIAYLLWQAIPDWDDARVEFLNIPPGTDFLCVASELNGEARTMNWSVRFFGRHEKPAKSGGFHDQDEIPPLPMFEYVGWQSGDRYAIIQRRKDDTFWITWFHKNNIFIPDRAWQLDTREIVFDLSKGKTDPLDAKQVKEFGLDEVPRFRNGKWEHRDLQKK